MIHLLHLETRISHCLRFSPVSFSLVIPYGLPFPIAFKIGDQGSVIHSNGLKYNPFATDSQMSISSPDLLSELQTHISKCLLNISTWMAYRHHKLNRSGTELIFTNLQNQLYKESSLSHLIVILFFWLLRSKLLESSLTPIAFSQPTCNPQQNPLGSTFKNVRIQQLPANFSSTHLLAPPTNHTHVIPNTLSKNKCKQDRVVL